MLTDTTEGSGYLSVSLYFSGAPGTSSPFDVADRDRERLRRYGSAETFNTEYAVGPEMLQRLRIHAEGQGARSPATTIRTYQARRGHAVEGGHCLQREGQEAFDAYHGRC
ncbi:MAG: hypothetical protein IPP26_16630 [Flavobacteriales bacterium]|nr:hypothetical protein [Flavobacteriales bacterium]